MESGDFSHDRSSGCQFQQMFSSQNYSNSPAQRFNKESMSNPKTQEGGFSGSSFISCKKCGKSHSGKCLVSTDVCYDCGKSNHKVRDFPSQSSKGATLYFVTPYVSMKFDASPKIL
ncbi:hypothetical protein MTR67_039846 [Solanum verrucosum]|uniref:Gag-pol polyprotein n=1 Tax=Solanum verrucosum TaxID=315347 RepID=A0AAF0UIZ3_SOLVR|nr:hypothetical protein MTR67_039846 [Solanum verrucosum]